MDAFEALNIKDSEVKALLSILAAIVLLGQAGAVSTSANLRFGQFQRPNEAHKVANLLGVSFQQLNDNVFCNLSTQTSSYHTKYGHSGSSAVSPDPSANGSSPSPIECVEGFCLGLYQEAITMLTNFINRSFKAFSSGSSNFYQIHHQSISNSMLIIDPPGFQFQAEVHNSSKILLSLLLINKYLPSLPSLTFYHITTQKLVQHPMKKK